MTPATFKTSKYVLIAGFGFSVLVIAVLSIVWVMNIQENNGNISGIHLEQEKSRLLVDMRDAARQRAIILHRMALMDDEFNRDDEYIKFKQMAGRFIAAREELFTLVQEDSKELELWNRAKFHIVEGYRVQKKAVELILNDQWKQANKLLLEEVIPTQNKVMETLSEMFRVQRGVALDEYYSLVKRNDRFRIIVISLAAISILLTLLAAAVAIKRTVSTEKSMLDAHNEAQQANQHKSQFLANMSHEIRSPLTAVLGYADMLLEPGVDEDSRYKMVGRIISSGKHLLGVINAILDFSKIEANQVDVELLDMSPMQLVKETHLLLQEQAQKKAIRFEVDFKFPLPSIIKTDPTRLNQILVNLCVNAIKFTDEGKVTLQLGYEFECDKLILTVKDTGIGMSLEQQHNLFRAFSQADISTSRKYGGTGLGLIISQQLARLLGGNLECRSTKDVGSEFTCTINAHVTPSCKFIESLSQSTVRQTFGHRERIPLLTGKVLLAEDSADNQLFISQLISKTGAKISVVENGQLAVEKASTEQYQLILMDIQMPIMSGLEATKRLREIGNQTPIAMLTANAMKQERENCLHLGANEFLSKPVDKSLFYAVLAKYLPQRDAELLDTMHSGQVSQELAAHYLASLVAKMHQLDELLKLKDWSAIQIIAHKLKGSGCSFGFERITEYGASIEQELKNSDTVNAARVLSELFVYADELLQKNSERPVKHTNDGRS